MDGTILVSCRGWRRFVDPEEAVRWAGSPRPPTAPFSEAAARALQAAGWQVCLRSAQRGDRRIRPTLGGYSLLVTSSGHRRKFKGDDELLDWLRSLDVPAEERPVPTSTCRSCLRPSERYLCEDCDEARRLVLHLHHRGEHAAEPNPNCRYCWEFKQ